MTDAMLISVSNNGITVRINGTVIGSVRKGGYIELFLPPKSDKRQEYTTLISNIYRDVKLAIHAFRGWTWDDDNQRLIYGDPSQPAMILDPITGRVWGIDDEDMDTKKSFISLFRMMDDDAFSYIFPPSTSSKLPTLSKEQIEDKTKEILKSYPKKGEPIIINSQRYKELLAESECMDSLCRLMTHHLMHINELDKIIRSGDTIHGLSSDIVDKIKKIIKAKRNIAPVVAVFQKNHKKNMEQY